MRILHVVPAYHPAVGGAGIHIRAVSERLAARGHHVTVFTRRVRAPLDRTPDPTLARAAMVNGVAVRRFDPSELLPRAAHTVRRLPVRVVGLPLFHTADPWVHSPLYPRLVAASDAMLANTSHEASFIEALVPTPPPIHTLGGGVDPEAFASACGDDVRHRWGLGTAPVVGYVGRMQPQKGVTRLLEAIRLVWAELPEARLLLAGARLPDDTREDRAFREGLAALPGGRRPQVAHIGPFADQEKASIFDACDVFAMPSTSESFGIAFLEAWIRGKPVIGARIGAVASVVDDGVDGLLVPPDSPRALADAIVALLRDPARSKALGEAGRRKTLERFTWDRITDQLEGVYATVARRGGGAGRSAP